MKKVDAIIRPFKVEVTCSDDSLQKVVDTILHAAQTGQTGDGKIFVSDLRDVIRIRTGLDKL